MSREKLVFMAQDALDHSQAGTLAQADGVGKIKAEVYTDPKRFEREKSQIFRRMPLMLAAACEIPNAGDYKTMDPVGVPVLLVRGKDGQARAFLNSCTHRGTNVALGDGNVSRFVCGYHGWTFNHQGELVGVAASDDFGDVDKDELCLQQFPILEKAGLIWVILDPKSDLDINTFLSGYDSLLESFGFENWHFFERRTLEGPNWKIAYDGYLDFYHLPVLHAPTFGADTTNRGNFYAFGPHQRILAPSTAMPQPDDTNPANMADVPDSEWSDDVLLGGVWTIFPHISIASFYQFSMLEVVVKDEDYATGIRQQKALDAGLTDYVYFGRNEGGGQVFHTWVEKLLTAKDDELNGIFEAG